MSDKPMRRLAAILAVDVVGYSRMMSEDENGTMAAMQAVWTDVFHPSVAEHRGRVVKMMGDGALVEFSSVIDAVGCAVAIQQTMVEWNANPDAPKTIEFRMGVNLGDIIIQDDDIFGDGVNVAARLEGKAPSGGVLASDIVKSQITGKIDVTFIDVGELDLKNIAPAVRAWEWRPSVAAKKKEEPKKPKPPSFKQEIRFCTAPDGAQIAYATVGDGPPIVKAPNWLSHLEYEWESPVWSHLLRELATDRTLVRFDQRGNGLSDWEADDISLDAFVSDLETVVDAAKLERFPLLGISQGCGISIRYAVRHPERVSHLILYGGFARGADYRGQEAKEHSEAMMVLIRHGWARDNPASRQMFTSSFIPEGTAEQMEWFNDLMRVSVSPDNAVRNRKAVAGYNLMDELAQVSVPTLVMHCRGDEVAPFNEGRRMAAGIPGARFVALESANHLILEHEPAWPRFVEEMRSFLAEE